MNTPTPETDALEKRHLQFESNSAITRVDTADLVRLIVEETYKLARKLECERDEAREWAAQLEAQMQSVCKQCFNNDDTIGLEPFEHYVARMVKNLKSERDQIRKVADELANRMGCGCGGDFGLCYPCCVASDAYNSLPHVIERKQL